MRCPGRGGSSARRRDGGDAGQHQRPSHRPSLFAAFRRRVMIDIDPGFTQFWHAQGLGGANVDGHDIYFTIGELIGTPGCSIPTGGIEWLPVRPPVVLDDWPMSPARSVHDGRKLARRRSGRSSSGRTYGLKVHEFRKFLAMPLRSEGARFEIALDIHPVTNAISAALRELGWQIVDPEGSGAPGDFASMCRIQAPSFPSRKASMQRPTAVGSAIGRRGTWRRAARRWFRTRASARRLGRGRPGRVSDGRGRGSRGRGHRRPLRRALSGRSPARGGALRLASRPGPLLRGGRDHLTARIRDLD